MGAVASTTIISKELRLSELSLEHLPQTVATVLPLAASLVPLFVWETSEEKHDASGIVSYAPARFSTAVIAPRRVYRGASWAEFEKRFSDVWLRQPSAAFPLAGGVVGYVAWDAANELEKIKGFTVSPGSDPLFFMSADRGVTLDRVSQTIQVWHVGDDNCGLSTRGAEVWCEQLLADIHQTLAASVEEGRRVEFQTKPAWIGQRYSRSEFESMVARAREYIIAGDVFQVVLSNRFDFAGAVSPTRLFDRLQEMNLSPYHFALRFGESAWYVGASPEVMLKSRSFAGQRQEVMMRPVAGTYPRRSEANEDRMIARQLAEDPKELAEHLMLVDLERNDIGRTAALGTVTVSDLFSVETYQHVHHLVSQVSGILRPGLSVIDALKGCFPIGTLSGTPKIRAMEIIAELEAEPRGIFGGAVVTILPGGDIDSCVAIRGALLQNDLFSIQTGAGIVYDSIPAREYEECLWKAKSILRALDLELPPA